MKVRMPLFRDLSAAQASWIRDLLREKRCRDQERAFVLEGAKPIQEVLELGTASVLAIVVTSQFIEKCTPALTRLIEAPGRVVYTCRARALEKIADVITPSGILAVIQQPEWNLASIFARRSILGLYGECVQDPANVGTIIRTAAAFGLDAVWLSHDSADVYNPKVVRATAGTLLRLPIQTIEDPAFFLEQNCVLLAAEPPGSGSRPIHEVSNVGDRLILAFGNESRGLSPTTVKRAAIRFHIPIADRVESLNVAASTAIAAFYFTNLQRRNG